MPVPIGPRQMSTITSPGRTRASLIAAIASRSVVKTRAGPVIRYTPSSSHTVGSMAVALMTEPSGAMLPCGKQIVEVSPRVAAASGDMMTSSGSVPHTSLSRARSFARRSLCSQASSCASRVRPLAVMTRVSSRPARRRCSITSGTPPARKTSTVGKYCGPFGSASTSRGTSRLTSAQSRAVGRRRPAACAMAGMCRSRFVEPPKAACVTIALRMAASVRMSRT